MARIPFQRPKHIEWEINTDRYGRLVAEPFEKGYALTVGNSLRRTLLSIIPGAAVAWVRIEGARDQEAHIPGVQEDTLDVLLNLRKLAVNVPSGEPMTTRPEAKGPKEGTGADVGGGGGGVAEPREARRQRTVGRADDDAPGGQGAEGGHRRRCVGGHRDRGA